MKTDGKEQTKRGGWSDALEGFVDALNKLNPGTILHRAFIASSFDPENIITEDDRENVLSNARAYPELIPDAYKAYYARALAAEDRAARSAEKRAAREAERAGALLSGTGSTETGAHTGLPAGSAIKLCMAIGADTIAGGGMFTAEALDRIANGDTGQPQEKKVDGSPALRRTPYRALGS